MPGRIRLDRMMAMLANVVRRLREARDELAGLDAATGDGDHGAAMCKVADAIEGCLDKADESRPIPALMSDIGWAIMEIDAGSTGPLYGSWFVGMGSLQSHCETLDATGFAAMIEAGLSNLSEFTAAQAGDKTMLDALIPAVDALNRAAEAGRPLDEALLSASQAATEGAQRTSNMQAKFGRARNIGNRSIGHVDPGAASMAIIFRALEGGLAHG